MKLTDRATETLEAYLGDVARALEGSADVDATDVIAGIREHVETELSVRGADPATAEDVTAILAGIGSPDELRGELAEPATASTRNAWPYAIAVLAAAVLGIGLAGTSWLVLGWALVVGSLVAARALLATIPRHAPEHRLLLTIWRIGFGAAAVAFLLAPAVLTWGSAQIGGVLEDALARHVGAQGAERPLEYWVAVSALAGVITGIWWIAIGMLTTRRADALRALWLAPLVSPRRLGRTLVACGATFLVLGLIGGLL